MTRKYLAICLGGSEDLIIDHILSILRCHGDTHAQVYSLPVSKLDTNRVTFSAHHNQQHVFNGEAGCGKLMVHTSCSSEVLFNIHMVMHWFAYISHASDLEINSFSGVQEKLEAILAKADWSAALSIWSDNTTQLNGSDSANIHTYAVRCIRGGHHAYSSQDISIIISNAFSTNAQAEAIWKVDLTQMKCEIVALLQNETIVVGMRIGQGNPFMRNRFPPELNHRPVLISTALSMRPSTASFLAHVVGVGPGDIVVDGMCGNGGLMLQSNASTGSLFIGCDCLVALQPVLSELRASRLHSHGSVMIEPALIAASKLPFRESTIDAFVMEYPSGPRIKAIAKHYRMKIPTLVEELARTLRVSTGRGVIVLQNYQHLMSCLNCMYFQDIKLRGVNIGGLVCAMVTFQRSDQPFALAALGTDTWDRHDSLLLPSNKRLKMNV